MEQDEKAIGYYEQSLIISREIKDRSGERNNLANLGDRYYHLVQYEKAKDSYEQALIISREINDKNGEVRLLNALGNLYGDLVQYDKAKDYQEKSLIISREIKDRLSESNAIMSLGFIYNALSQYGKAMDYYNQALIINREIKNQQSEGRILRNLGRLYLKLDQNDKAKNYLEQSLIIGETTKNKILQGSSLNSLGLVYMRLKQYDEAKDYLERGLIVSRESKSRNLEAVALNLLGYFYFNLEQYEKAGNYYEQALASMQETKDRSGEASIFNSLLLLYKELKNPQLAIFYGKQSVNIFQEIRGSIKALEEESQKSFLKDKEKVYRDLSDLLISESRLSEAQAVLDLLKEEEYAGLLRRNALPGNTNIVPYSKTEEAVIKILDQLAALGREKGDLAAKSERDTLTETERQRFKELQAEIEISEAEFDKSIKSLSASSKGQNLNAVVNDAQAFMNDLRQMGDGTVALYTVIADDSSEQNIQNRSRQGNTVKEQTKTGWIILITPEFRKAYPIDTTNLEQTVFKFRTVLSSPNNDPLPVAQELYRKLFLQTSAQQKTTLADDLKEYFKGKPNATLMWSLDGILRYVPIAALHDGKQYLVEKFRNTVFNTASKGRLKDSVKAKWSVFGLGVTQGRDEAGMRFPPLSGVKRELSAIVRQKDVNDNQGVLPGIVKLDDQFTSDAMYDGLLFDKNPVVHIASHFSFQSANFDESFLLLGKGRVTVRELSSKSTLFSNVDLLTLSACDTAMGDNNGKEVEGFAYLAQSLGAKAVLATLWQIDDIGTQILMPEFYRLHESGVDKAEALRQAQLALLRGKIRDNADKQENLPAGTNQAPPAKQEKTSFAHPFYWAPFILIGNWH